jgi:hypothetical protein
VKTQDRQIDLQVDVQYTYDTRGLKLLYIYACGSIVVKALCCKPEGPDEVDFLN